MNADVVAIMTEVTETGGTGIGLDLVLEDDRGITLDPDLVQDLRLDQEGMFQLLLSVLWESRDEAISGTDMPLDLRSCF